MNDATAKIVEELAAKLGTTAEHLWGVLCRQAPISSACDIAIIIAWTIGLVWTFRLIRSKSKEPEDGDAQMDSESAFWAWTAWSVACFLVVIISGVSFATIVAGFANPEYWALQQVIQ